MSKPTIKLTYIIKLGDSEAEVIAPPGCPSPDPSQPLELWIGKQKRRDELPPATITIDGQTYPARLVRDHSLDAS